ncbi:hypothetical protein BH24DEI2_BH24DEI2_03220 [soil metagenome]
MNIRVGTLAVVKKSTAICAVDELGVCYELYELEGRPGYSFVFESGGYDGFSPDDVEAFLEVTDVVVPSVASYEFSNVTQLKQDYRRGRFAEAFPARARA